MFETPLIESTILPPDATGFLVELQQRKAAEADRTSRLAISDELLNFCNRWFASASAWRAQSYEQDWHLWQRNSDSKYDPRLAAAKKPWQSKAFVDITPSHRENIHAALFKMVAGTKPPIEMQARVIGDAAQADNIRDLIVRELEKSHFETAYDQILGDADTFGSGFCRIRWDETTEPRLIRQPIIEPLDVLNPGSLARHITGKSKILGYEERIQEKLIYRGVRLEYIPILDFFPDPKAMEIKGNPCAFRFHISYEDIVRGTAAGYYLPEAAEALRDVPSEEIEPQEKQQEQASRGIAEAKTQRTDRSKKHEIKELYARLPQKWIFPFLQNRPEITDPDGLIPARVLFHKQTLCAVELNQNYDGEAPHLKMDYMKVNGRFYGRGIPEMLKNPQEVINEVVNQRLDEGALALNEGYAVVEKAIVNPKELEGGGPGLVVRLNAKALGPNGDVRNAIFPLGRPDVKRAAGFSEVYEWERIAQERTSANRVTLGSVGLVRDSNNTLGGQELLKEQAGEKFAYIALSQEFYFLVHLFRAYWKLIYSHIQPEDVFNTLGPERAQTFVLMSPEEIDMAYKYIPQGLFEMGNKGLQQAKLQSIFQQFAPAPFVNPESFFDQITKSAGLDPAPLKYSPEDMQTMILAQHQMRQAQTPLPPPQVQKEQNVQPGQD